MLFAKFQVTQCTKKTPAHGTMNDGLFIRMIKTACLRFGIYRFAGFSNLRLFIYRRKNVGTQLNATPVAMGQCNRIDDILIQWPLTFWTLDHVHRIISDHNWLETQLGA